MAEAEHRKLVDYAKLLEKYTKFTRPLKKTKEEEEQEQAECDDNGFLIKFRLSKAYRNLERQEVEAAKPNLTPYRSRSARRRNREDEEARKRKEEEDAALRAKRRKEKEQEKQRKAKPKKLSFWQMMKKTQEAKKAEKKKKTKAKLTRENDPRYSKNFKPLWYEQKQSIKSNGRTSKTPDSQTSSEQADSESGDAQRARRGSSRQRHKDRRTPDTPLTSIQEEPSGSGRELTAELASLTSARQLQAGRGRTFLTQGNFVGKYASSQNLGDSLGSIKGILKKRSTASSVADSECLDSEYPDSGYQESQMSRTESRAGSRPGSAARSTRSLAPSTLSRSQSLASVADRPDSRAPSRGSAVHSSMSLPRDSVKRAQSMQSIEQRLKGISFSHTSTRKYHPTDRPGTVSQGAEETGEVKKNPDFAYDSDTHTQRQVARYLYHMCNCHHVSKHATLSKLTKKKKVSGVIEIYGCPEEETRDPRCPFCSVFPKRRVEAWLESVDGELEDPYPPPFNPYTCYKVSS